MGRKRQAQVPIVWDGQRRREGTDTEELLELPAAVVIATRGPTDFVRQSTPEARRRSAGKIAEIEMPRDCGSVEFWL